MTRCKQPHLLSPRLILKQQIAAQKTFNKNMHLKLDFTVNFVKT